IFVLIDEYSRFVLADYASDATSATLLLVLKKMLLRFPTQVTGLVLDRQTGFTSTEFVRYLTEVGITHRFCPPNRHDVFNGAAERTIQSLRIMARTSMAANHLSPLFWRSATLYAVFVKNRLPHESLRGTSPYFKLYQKPI